MKKSIIIKINKNGALNETTKRTEKNKINRVKSMQSITQNDDVKN
jgi:hypothetical protein